MRPQTYSLWHDGQVLSWVCHQTRSWKCCQLSQVRLYEYRYSPKGQNNKSDVFTFLMHQCVHRRIQAPQTLTILWILTMCSINNRVFCSSAVMSRDLPSLRLKSERLQFSPHNTCGAIVICWCPSGCAVVPYFPPQVVILWINLEKMKGRLRRRNRCSCRMRTSSEKNSFRESVRCSFKSVTDASYAIEQQNKLQYTNYCPCSY